MSRAIGGSGLLLALVLVLAGCTSGGHPNEPGVAALAATPGNANNPPPQSPSSQQNQAGSQAGSQARQGQERLDDSDEQHANILNAYSACLVAHGAKYVDNHARLAAAAAAGQSNPYPIRLAADPVPAAARAACHNKVPLGPPEMEPDQNPHYRDDWVANVKCLRAHGYQVHLTDDTSDGPGGLGWAFDDDATSDGPANGAQIEKNCELAAFSGKK